MVSFPWLIEPVTRPVMRKFATSRVWNASAKRPSSKKKGHLITGLGGWSAGEFPIHNSADFHKGGNSSSLACARLIPPTPAAVAVAPRNPPPNNLSTERRPLDGAAVISVISDIFFMALAPLVVEKFRHVDHHCRRSRQGGFWPSGFGNGHVPVSGPELTGWGIFFFAEPRPPSPEIAFRKGPL